MAGKGPHKSHWKEILAEGRPSAGKGSPTRFDGEQPKMRLSGRTRFFALDEEPAGGKDAEQPAESEENGKSLDRARSTSAPFATVLQRSRPIALGVSAATLAAVVAVLILGNLDRGPYRVPVSGRVLVNGKPLTSGTIQVIPVDEGRPSIGRIDSQGRFQLICFDGTEGAIVGRHHIEILPPTRRSDPNSQWPLPATFSNYETSGTFVEIVGPTGELEVNLVIPGPQTAAALADSARS